VIACASLCRYLFLCSLLWSFVDTYFVAALTLYTIVEISDDRESEVVSMSDLVTRAQMIGEQVRSVCCVMLCCLIACSLVVL
jgi:hypothetical protein